MPVLTTAFVYFLHTPHLVHLAIGTSMATILVTAVASIRAHQKHDAIRWDIVKTLTPGILLGGLFGGWVSQFFNANTLAQIFAVIELVIAIKMLTDAQPNPHRELPGLAARSVAGTFIGAISSLVGIGGGALNTPYMVWHNVYGPASHRHLGRLQPAGRGGGHFGLPHRRLECHRFARLRHRLHLLAGLFRHCRRQLLCRTHRRRLDPPSAGQAFETRLRHPTDHPRNQNVLVLSGYKF